MIFGLRQVHFLIHILMMKQRSWSSRPWAVTSMKLSRGPDLISSNASVFHEAIHWLISHSSDLGFAESCLLHKHDEELVKLASRICEWCAEQCVEIMTPSDDVFPESWKRLKDAPHAFFIAGNVELLRFPIVSIVGARKAMSSAMQVGFDIGRYLAACGAVVVSGGAVGCDTAAHLGAIAGSQNQMHTVVIQAGGLAHLYPAANHRMFQKIKDGGGVLISERLPFDRAMPWDFLYRNRLIAGLGIETVVLQAAKKSGAMVTARHALDQGRDVYVLKHALDDIRASGSHDLIEDGALSFVSANDYVFGAS